MDTGVCALELLGVFFSSGAWLCSLATTLMSTWLTLSTDLLPAENYELGLWETCVVHERGVLECRPYNSLLGLPPDIRLARILMCTTLATGLLGLALTISSMHVLNSCERTTEELRCKRAIKTSGGALCVCAGILELVPVSYVAHLTVGRFFDETLPDMVPRWELGDALFCGWMAGVLHVASGTLLLASLYVHKGHAPIPQAEARPCPRSEYV